jgi:hypothetical protein
MTGFFAIGSMLKYSLKREKEEEKKAQLEGGSIQAGVNSGAL